MKVYGKVDSGKIIFLALEQELSAEEKEKGWESLGDASEREYASVMNGTWLGQPLHDENHIANYRFVNGEPLLRTEMDKQEELAERPPAVPTDSERLTALEKAMLSILGGVSG